MSPGPGSNKRPTGAVPKTKPQRKNSVPQEMVAPTRRDLQEHLNEFFASVAERASKPDNTTPQHQQNRTRTPAENCFDLENLTLQENTRFCWPVRPIPRRNFLHEDMNDPHSSTGQNSSGTNAAIGVVIPTTPNTSGLHHQQLHDHITNTYIANHNIRSNQTPDAFADNGQRATSVENGPQQTPAAASVQISAANIEDRLNQIQEYIRITSSLINSIQTDKSSSEHTEDLETLSKNLDNLKDSEEKLLRLLSEFPGSRMVNTDRNGSQTPLGITLNSNSLESVLSPTEVIRFSWIHRFLCDRFGVVY